MDKAEYIFYKIAKMSPSKRNAMEDEMHEFNRAHAKRTLQGKEKTLIPVTGAIGAAVGAAAAMNNYSHTFKAKNLFRLNKTQRMFASKALTGAGIGAAAGAVLTGLGSAYWLKRDKSYMKNAPDANLARGIQGIREYKKGDKEALNRAYWDVANEKKPGVTGLQQA